jgi:Flp pilus assembly protein TadG
MTARRLARSIAFRFRRFGLAERGAAAVEFALILPLMLLLYVGSIEVSDLISVDRRVTVVSSTLGDLVARTDGNLAQSTLNDYFNASAQILTPYTTTGLKQLITSVYVAANGTATVRWNKQSGGATTRANGTVLTLQQLPAEIRDISRGKYVIMSEVSYAYQPMMGMMFQTPITLVSKNFHLPRFGKEITSN